LVQASTINQAGSFFTLTILVTPGDAFDYGVFIAKYLRDLNINSRIKVVNYDCNIPNSYPKINKNWDLAICKFENKIGIPDLRDIYTEDGFRNIFNLNSDIPFQNESEYLQNEAAQTLDLEERQQLYFDWQQLLMKHMIPILPLFSDRIFTTIWSNTEGWDMRWGLSDSITYMMYNGLHKGQKSADELNVAFSTIESNKLDSVDIQLSLLEWSLIKEPLLKLSPDNLPLKTGIIREWEEIKSHHLKFYIRNNSFWNPSFNSSGRDSTSDSLLIETSPDKWEVRNPSILMSGLKDGEVSDGTNKNITAKDAVFTLLTASNPLTSEKSDEFMWLSNCYVDPLDPLAFHVHIDGNQETEVNEPYADFFSLLDIGILPEFFLNSTDETITYTSGGIKCKGLNETIKETINWKSYEISPFGGGKFMLDYYEDNFKTVLTRSPFWFKIGVIDGEERTPFIDTINIYDIQDEEEIGEKFRNGELDLVRTFEPPVRMSYYEMRYEVQTLILDHMYLIAFNFESEFFGKSSNNIWVEGPDGKNYTEACTLKRAICYTIDRVEMDEVIHGGDHILGHSPIFFNTPYYHHDEVKKYYRNITAAWREFDSTRRFKVGINTTRTTHPSIIAVLCLILTSKITYYKKARRKR
ncbi:MAG: hypothetical protein H7641_01665, partial [Candidatus Heimdallarchaeota archaeon]|nr:hypothetical protein [Candidatus Heimdallarchaeota archaeon]MCK4876270.1 hypothetical protein [Candidatus Heimdallarchaeota archaeon]